MQDGIGRLVFGSIADDQQQDGRVRRTQQIAQQRHAVQVAPLQVVDM